MSSVSRKLALSALLGATMLVAPLTAKAADADAPAAASVAAPIAGAPHAERETVEQRITSLHASLNITPGEEANWNGVTKAMRDNAAVMDKLVAEQSAVDPASMTAVQDLKTYEKFAHAHMEGLKTLTSSFEILYQAMSEAQRKTADQVFQNFGHEKAAS